MYSILDHGGSWLNDFFLIYMSKNVERNISIQDVYKIDERGENIATAFYGHFDPANGILNLTEPNLWKRRGNLQLYTIK